MLPWKHETEVVELLFALYSLTVPLELASFLGHFKPSGGFCNRFYLCSRGVLAFQKKHRNDAPFDSG